MAIEIVDWDKHYENNRTRDMKVMGWLPLPINLSGDGYTQLLDHKNGAAHFGAWCALLEVAARCGKRGTLMRSSGTPHDADSLARITRVPESIWKEVLPRLTSIGWIRNYLEGAEIPQKGAAIPHLSANELNGTELNGTELKDTMSSSTTAYDAILSRLNEKANTSFKASSGATQRLIHARMNEGFKEQDFFTVIDFKCSQWKGNPEMLQYLRPSTLFSPKFESYLQAARNAEVVKEDEKRKRLEQRDSRAPQGRF